MVRLILDARLKYAYISAFILLLNICILTPLHSIENNKNPLVFSTYFKNKFSLEKNINSISLLNLKNELNMSFNLPLKIYQGCYWIDDLFLIDFVPLLSYPDMQATDLFYNSFTTGIENNFKIKKIMNIAFNFEFGINSPFYDNTSLYFNPIFGINGSYYFGYFWNIEQSLPIDYTPTTNISVFTSSTYCKLGYEFFRYYGPKNFKLGLLIDNILNLSYPYPASTNTLYDLLRAGAYLNFYGVGISVYYILIHEANLGDSDVFSRINGIKAGFSFINKWFTLSIDYTGSIDQKITDAQWTNRIDVYLKASIYSK